MKKISMILFVTALLLSFTACKGEKKAEEVVVPETPAAVVAEEAPPVVELTPAQALKAFTAFAKEYAEANNNKLNDVQKFQKLANQVTEKIAEMSKVKDKLTPAQVKEYEKAIQIIRDVNSPGKK
jgi:septal ring factor EnvC (AmiA/AmiB activator)